MAGRELSNESMEDDDDDEEDATDATGSDEDTSEESAGSVELRELEFLWVPPEGYSGDVRFLATVVEGFTTFYVGIQSEVVFFL